VTQAIPDVEERPQRHRDRNQQATERDLADFDATTDLDFLPRGQQGDLADLLEIETDGILAARGQRRERLLRYRVARLCLVLDQLRLLGDLLRRQRRRHGVARLGLLITFPECHAVTRNSSLLTWLFRCAHGRFRFPSTLDVPPL